MASEHTTGELIWKPEALVHYPLIEHVHLSPGGNKVLYTVRTAHMTEDASEFRNHIFLADAQATDAPRRLTHGAGASSPKWSPDGQTIAFLRHLPESTHVGLWLMPSTGGEAWPLIQTGDALHESITHFEWRPDGKAIAFTAVPSSAERTQRQREKDDVVHHHVDYDFAHLFLVEFSNDPALPPHAEHVPTWQQMTTGRFHIENFAWHPQGIMLAVIAQDTPYIDSWPSNRLLTMKLPKTAGASPDRELALVSHIAAEVVTLAYSPDGAWIACPAGIDENHWPYASRMMLFPADSGSKHAPQPLADVSDAQMNLIGWTPDSRQVIVANQQGLGTEILALPIDGSAAQIIVPGTGPSSVYHHHNGTLALVRQDYNTPNSIALVDLTSRQLSHLATPQIPEFPCGPMPQTQELCWHTPDGFEIEGILYLPQNYAPASGQKLPLLLHIHGGPASLFQRAYAATPYYYTPASLCELGFAVLRCNPRGSSGYGKDFRFANLSDWGGGDYRDLMQGVDTVIEMGIADPERLGVCGWSYGGFMTSWIITQTHRFRAASIGAPVTNPMTFSATADIPSFVPDYYGGEAWQVFDFYQERSPVFHAHKVRTPAIIQHGDADPRVPLEQGLQYYYVLARNNVPVDLFIYPRQGHAILEPRLLIDAMRRNLNWFSKHLGTDA